MSRSLTSARHSGRSEGEEGPRDSLPPSEGVLPSLRGREGREERRKGGEGEREEGSEGGREGGRKVYWVSKQNSNQP